MELDKFEFEIRDILLEAFGKQDSLTREHLLELFDYDEPMAAAIVGVLSADGLVAEVGLSEQNYLPVLLVKKPAVEAFLQNGGYTRQYELLLENAESAPVADKKPQQNPVPFQPDEEEHSPEIIPERLSQKQVPQFEVEEKIVSDANASDLLQLNAVLQKENKQYKQTIRERDEEIKALNLKLKQQEYLKYLWWFAGTLLLIIIILSYMLHGKAHQ